MLGVGTSTGCYCRARQRRRARRTTLRVRDRKVDRGRVVVAGRPLQLAASGRVQHQRLGPVEVDHLVDHGKHILRAQLTYISSALSAERGRARRRPRHAHAYFMRVESRNCAFSREETMGPTGGMRRDLFARISSVRLGSPGGTGAAPPGPEQQNSIEFGFSTINSPHHRIKRQGGKARRLLQSARRSSFPHKTAERVTCSPRHGQTLKSTKCTPVPCTTVVTSIKRSW